MATDEQVKAACEAFERTPKVSPAEQGYFDSMRAALEAADDKAWMPFSGAPEDGTIIDVYRPDVGVFSAHYVQEDAHLSSQHSPPEGDYYWFSTNGDDLTGDLPTMFRHRPTPPKEPTR